MIYVFECKECSHTWEEKLAIKDMDLPLSDPCPSCHKEDTVIRVIGAVAFHLKGMGWEDDGYASHYGDTLEYKEFNDDE